MTFSDWIEIAITFNTKFNECGKEYYPERPSGPCQQKLPGICLLQDIMETTPEFVKREPVAELQCFVCGKKTGCNECEYLAKCDV
jgi:hypothetical protein